MTFDAASLPADLREWLDGHLPGIVTEADASWERDTSRVWRVDTGTTTAYVKISPTRASFAQETGAYQHAKAALAPGEAPHLLASDPDLRAILTAQLPGRIVRGLPLAPATEIQVHGLAGRLLCRWHEHSEPAPAHARDTVMASMIEQANEAAVCLDSLGDELDGAVRALVAEVARDLPELAASLPLVYRHGDYSTRNWLWDEKRQALGVIDFEMAAHGLAVQDMTWLFGALWTTRPDLQQAFLTGLGRDLSTDEHCTLALLATRLGVSYLRTGLTKDDRVLIDRGRNGLTALVRALN